MKRNNILVFGFLVFVCLFSQSLGGDNNNNKERRNYPVLRNGTYDIRESTLLSQHWKVAVIDFDIIKGEEGEGEEDEGELHFPVLVPCFECLSKDRYTKNEEGKVCVCNFASKSKEECGKAPKGCPSSTCDPVEVKRKCFNDEKGDREKREWTEVHVSQTQKEDVTRLRNQSLSSLNERKYFRFHSSDPCRGYKIKVHFHSGLVDLLLSREHAWPDDLHQEWSTTSETYPDATEIPLCPEFKSFGLGTYYLAVVSRTPEAVFDLLIYTQEPTLDKPEFKGQTNEPCDGGAHTCIHPGVPFKFTQPLSGQSLTLPFRFDFPVKKGECKTITAYLNADEGDAGLAGDFELPFPNYYYGGNPQFHSEYPGSDFHHFQRCFEETEERVSYYMSVFVWTSGNYTLRVSLNKTPILVPTSELTPYQYAFSSIRTLIGKCPGTSPQITWMCQDWRSYCGQFWLTYPAEDPNPFWPTPAMWRTINSPLAATMFSSLIDLETPLKNRKPGSLSLVMLLSNTIFGKENTYITEEDLEKCIFASSYNARNKEGFAIQGVASIEKKKPVCEKEELNSLVELGTSYLEDIRDTTSFNRVLQLSFQVDLLKFSQPWVACSRYASSLIRSTEEEVPTLTTACFITNQTSEEYLNDPCCNINLRASKCCLPRYKNISTSVFQQVNKREVERVCSDPKCSISYLNDWKTLNQQNIQCSRFESDMYPSLIEAGLANFQDCKTRYNIDKISLGRATCSSDKECEFGGFRTKCNRVTNRCIPTQELELETTRCMLRKMSRYTEHFFEETLSLLEHKEEDIEDFLRVLIPAVSRNQCRNDLGDQTSLIDTKEFLVINKQCDSARQCNSDLCLDTSCEIAATTCTVFCSMNWVGLDTEKSSCNRAKKCNWIGDGCEGSDCKDCYKPLEHFCGYCYDDAHCIQMPQVQSRTECEDLEACLLPDGTMELMPKEECLQQQSCTEPCYDGMSCESASGLDNACISTDNQETCSGTWREDLNVCVMPLLGEVLCLNAGFSFYTCNRLDLEECGSCYEGSVSCPVSNLLQCHVVPRSSCSSKGDCEKISGTCDDTEFYSAFGKEDDDFGACIYPLAQSSWSGVFPICYFGTMTPQGCYVPTYTSQEECFGVYHKMASSKEECLATTGCNTYNSIRVLSPLSTSECSACGHETFSYYRWTPGHWVSGTPVKLTWKKRQVISLYDWDSTIDFELIQQVFLKSVQASLFSDLKSQTLCDFNARKEVLQVIACACSEGGSSDCFSSSSKAIETGSGRPCIGLGSEIQNSVSSVTVSDSAISEDSGQRCVSITLSLISYLSMKQPEQLPFSPLTRIRDYNSFGIVLNKDHAIVGRLMSDGVLLEMDGPLEAYQICLQVSEEADEPSSSSKFSHWDLGVPRDDDQEFLTPLGLSPETRNLNNRTTSSHCFEVLNPKQKESYFLIARSKNFKKEDGSLYGRESIAWWVFAGIYSILGFLSLAAVVLHFLGYKIHLYFVGIFVSLAAMCTIRAAYFFLVACEVFDDGGALWVQYFLIELPTLLYVSTFSFLAGFWVHLLTSMKGKRSVWISYTCTVFNAILYVIFVVLLILYQTLPEDGSESACPDRVSSKNDNTNFQIIIILYQSIMAGASLLLALIVLAFGLKLFSKLRLMGLEVKVAAMTLICASGLLVHCSFILYLSVDLEYHFTLILIMMTIGELLPITAFAIQFYTYLFKTIKKQSFSGGKRGSAGGSSSSKTPRKMEVRKTTSLSSSSGNISFSSNSSQSPH